MKKSFIGIMAATVLMAGNLVAQVADLDDLNYWGTGPNRAAFIVQWNDAKSPTALAWGYNWSGSQTVADMLFFLAANDPILFARIDSATNFGPSIFGIGYQTGPTPFGVTGAEDTVGNPVTPTFVAGIDDLNTNPATTQAPASSLAAAPANPADRYSEGWNDTGFWELYNSGTDNFALEASFALPMTWTSSFVGASTTLVDESWAAFSFAPILVPGDPPVSVGVTSSVTAAIPEPGSIALLGLGVGSIVLWFRRRQSRRTSTPTAFRD